MKTNQYRSPQLLALTGVLFACVLFFSDRANAQNLIQDGGFEFGLTSVGNPFYSSTSYGNWSSVGSPTATYLMRMPNGSNPAYEGNEAMLIGNAGLAGFVTQTVSTEVGKRYRLSLAVIEIEGNAGLVRATASSATKVDLVALFAAPGANDWSTTYYEFVASGSTTTVKIENVPGAACAIDAVVLEAANLLTDGGFELGLTPGANSFAGGTTFGGWSAVGSPANSTYLLGTPNGTVPAFDGREAMLIGSGARAGFVTQSLTTTIGQTYWLSFAVNAADGAAGTVQATVNSQPGLVQNFSSPGANEWTVASYPFVAGSTTTAVRIRNVSGPSIIDDVRVSAIPLDRALALDGINDHATLGNGINLANKSFTVELWAKRGDANTGFQTLVSQGTAGTRINLHLGFNNNKATFRFYNDDLDTSAPYTDFAWHHWAFTYDSASRIQTISRDGIVVAQRTAGGNYVGNGTLFLGQNLNVSRFHGQMDEIRIWNVARTGDDIRANLYTRLAGSEPGLVAYHRMDGGTGQPLTDLTANGNNGTLVNGTLRIVSTVPPCPAFENLYVDPLNSSRLVAEYEGAHGAGVSLVDNVFTMTDMSVFVTNLCYDITPDSGTAGVELRRQNPLFTDRNVGLTFDSGPWTLKTTGDDAAGLSVTSVGSAGSKGANGTLTSNNGSAGTPGGSAGASMVNSMGSISTTGSASPGILALSQGGRGGAGGNGYNNVVGDNDGGNGAVGGDAGAVMVEGSGDIVTMGADSTGVLALSQAGQGGNGGEGSAAGEGGNGGGGGDAGSATVDGSWHVDTLGDSAYGISARSVGGAGGGPGTGGYIDGDGGWGGGSGDGSLATAFLRPGGTIDTWGSDAHGVFAQSIGGLAGSGASGDSIFSSAGGNGGSAGSGGDVLVSNEGTIHTRGHGANAIFAESVGGGGGSGGAGDGLFSGRSEAGASSAGDNGGVVTVENFGALETEGAFARGIFAQSVGGSGGNGSTAAGKFYSIGSDGGPGGDGNLVDVYNEGSIVTSGDDSVGLFAQSVGGGGGAGGGAVSAGSFAVAIGGSGAKGGDGSSVFVDTSELGTIETSGERSHGIFAQSVGGGGGNGGFAVSLAAGGAYTMAASVGGSGAEGGSASNVVVTSASDITTGGMSAHGIVAQSVGGGGGGGGFSVSLSAGAVAGSVSVGGGGGGGGDGRDVSLSSSGNVWTKTDRSYGLFAQSVGGGGGDGGFSISGAIGAGGLAAGLGGSGGVGGNGDSVFVENDGEIMTEGADAHGIVAQSVGGGGGSGGFNISAAGGIAGALSAGLGGSGGAGGSAGTVTVDNWNLIQTVESRSYGILAQSVGGGGGDGGFSVAVSGAYEGPALAFSFGGDGGEGGTADAVDVYNEGEIYTDGEQSHGIMAQSVGGGGGSGGFAASAALSVKNGALGFSMGGDGGTGNDSGEVAVENAGFISTIGDDASGVFAQSVGGGGGNGGASFSGSFTGGASKSATVALGGTGGGGGNGDLVNVSNDGEIETYGRNARGIFAQSVGGGGGNGGMSGSINLGVSSAGNSTQVAVSLGGKGGSGGVGGDVLIDGSGDVYTEGDASEGIFAQSIGGGGGNGGASLAVTLSLGNASNATNASYALAVGGEGGSGNFGGTVTVDRGGQVETKGDGSHGIFAQSVGGGGGTGGSARAVSLFLKTSGNTATNFSNKAKSLSFGGSGGDGGFGGAVAVTNVGAITTSGGDAHGIMAQSVGGGGGIGGNGHKALTDLFGDVLIDGVVHQYVEATKAKAKITKLNFGGTGGTGNHGGSVDVDQTGDITTEGDGSYGVMAQSVGAGGGVGGNGTVDVDATGVLQGEFTLGGSALISDSGSTNASGNGAAVTVKVDGKVDTTGTGAHGIVAQSVGGGGGLAGNIERGLKTVGSALGYDTSYRGDGGGGEGDGGAVIVDSADDIVTRGSGATGIFAQSVGGGGGVAGNLGEYAAGEAPLNFAGSVGGVGSGGDVIVSHVGNISTLDSSAHGIYAQSAGGIGTGGLVSVSIDGQINTSGAGSDGIFAQSRGSQGAGNVSVTVEDGAGVQGGSGTGVGVRMVSRGTSTLINRGTISSVSGAAVATLYGNNTVQNFGTISGTVYLAGSGTFNNWAGATLDLDTGGSAYIGPDGTLSNSGLIRGTGEITGNVGSSGEIRAGNSPGSITINGSLSLTSSAGMFFDIGGTQPGVTHDVVNVTSFVELAGNLSLSLDNNFIPSSTDSFTLLGFDSATGLFGNAAEGARLSTADNLASFQVNYTATSVELTGYESPDTDGDGMTDYEESLAGTDRSSDASVLAFSAVARNTSGDVLMQFPRVAGKTYVIEYATDLNGGSWTEISSPVFTFPDANTAQWIDDGTVTVTSGVLFYRVKLKL